MLVLNELSTCLKPPPTLFFCVNIPLTSLYLSSDFLNSMGLGSGEQIPVTSGMGDITEGKAMVGMDILCHRLRV
jgi:hypothetical protein